MDKHLAPEEHTPRRVDVKRVVIASAAVLLLGFIAVVAGFSMALHRTPIQVITGQFAASPQELFGKDHLLVLAEGLDYDYTDKDEEFSKQSRSDVIKAINLDFRTHKVYVLSIPRDTDVVLPNGDESKINQAQADGGVKEAQGVIARFLGIPGFDRYVVLRINTTKDLVNAIGGVNVYAKTSNCLMYHEECTGGRIDYDDNWGHLHIHFTEGMHHMNGDQAVAYARFRHDWCSDPCRIMRQNQVMQAALNKLRSDKFNTLVHLNDLIGVFHRDVDTNLTQQEEVALATSFADMPKNGLVTDTIKTLGDKELTYAGDVLVPDQAGIARQVQNMLLDPPVPTPSPDAAAIAAINPFSVRVDVENGTSIPGAARRVAAVLKQKGFTIAEIGNASSEDFATTELREHSQITFAGLRVREALGKAAAGAHVVADSETPTPDATASTAQSDVTVIVGEDLASATSAQASTQP